MSSYIRTGWETGFFQSPNCIFDVTDLTNNEKLCYLYLCRCADKDMKSFPSYATIAEKMSVSRRTAINIINSLEQKGYLKVKSRRVSKEKNLSNIYTIVHPDQIIHNGETDSPEQMIGSEMIAPDGEMIAPDGEMIAPNKYSLKNTHLKKDIYINSDHA